MGLADRTPPTVEEYDAWREFYGCIEEVAAMLAASLLSPLQRKRDLQQRIPAESWDLLVENPIGAGIERVFRDDAVRVRCELDVHDDGVPQIGSDQFSGCLPNDHLV